MGTPWCVLSANELFDLEVDTQSELHKARVSSSTGYLTKRCRIKCLVCAEAEVSIIENVEHFCSEFNIHFFGDPCAFQQTEVCLEESRPVKEIAREIAKCSQVRRADNSGLQLALTATDYKNGWVKVEQSVWRPEYSHVIFQLIQ